MRRLDPDREQGVPTKKKRKGWPHLSDSASDVRGPDRFHLGAAWAATAERGRWEGERSEKMATGLGVAIADRQGRVAATDFYRRARQYGRFGVPC